MSSQQYEPPTQAEVLRPATRADLGRIVELINHAYEVEKFFVRGARTDEDEIRQRLDSGSFLLVESHKGLLGSIYLEIAGQQAYFGLLSVRPNSQRSGIGRRLIEAAERHAQEQGCRQMNLRVVNLREELPPFYRRLGYREIGAEPFPTPQDLLQPCHFVLMTKDL